MSISRRSRNTPVVIWFVCRYFGISLSIVGLEQANQEVQTHWDAYKDVTQHQLLQLATGLKLPSANELQHHGTLTLPGDPTTLSYFMLFETSLIGLRRGSSGEFEVRNTRGAPGVMVCYTGGLQPRPRPDCTRSRCSPVHSIIEPTNTCNRPGGFTACHTEQLLLHPLVALRVMLSL